MAHCRYLWKTCSEKCHAAMAGIHVCRQEGVSNRLQEIRYIGVQEKDKPIFLECGARSELKQRNAHLIQLLPKFLFRGYCIQTLIVAVPSIIGVAKDVAILAMCSTNGGSVRNGYPYGPENFSVI